MADCLHTGCKCSVEDGEYCSDHCREHGQHAEQDEAHGCDCGHSECEEATA